MSSKKSQTGFQKLDRLLEFVEATRKCEWCDKAAPYVAFQKGKPVGQACEEHLVDLTRKDIPSNG